MSTTKKHIGFINCAPTWESILPVLTEVAINGKTHEGRSTAETELRRMAALADRWQWWSREGA